MTLQLPQHLQGRQSHNIAEKAAAGIGASLPPHISIRGNTFTLVDAGGQEAAFPVGTPLDIVIADTSGTPPPKRYYKNKWTPDSNEPPTCWSMNGVVPDAGATEKQARSCAECQLNERGSAVSAISGVAIKACRDEKWTAVILPAYPNMIFQLVITPGSFKNWQAYTKNFGNGVDISDVVTRVTFQPQVNGVMVFEILGHSQNNPQYISNDVLKVLEAAWAEKKTDVLVGRDNSPVALAAPTSPAIAGPGYETASVHITTGGPGTTNAPFVPAQFVAAGAPQFSGGTSAAPVNGPAQVEQPQRRRRRTNAEIQAAQGQPQAQQTVPVNPAPLQAPFAPQPFAAPANSAPAGNGTNFGMAPGAAPNADMTKTLEGLFGKKPAQ